MRVLLSRAAQGELVALPVVVRARVYGLLERLSRWPEVSGAKPLRGEFAGQYRLRTGDYRLRFRIERDRVIVEQIGHRDGFYEE
jgi:mRNA-degrading endonuclease RelE of RelBE toxin-antitoxin system